MGRQDRFRIAGIPQHIVHRGVDRQACFFEREDYETYLELIGPCAEKADCDVHAYVLMTNHVHLLVTPRDPSSVIAFMQALPRRYVHYVNARYGRTGTLWEGRYKSTVVGSDEYVLAVYRYICLNPVRAGLVRAPEAYRWSSYRHHAGGCDADSDVRLTPHAALGRDDASRSRNFLSLVATDPHADVENTIRDSTRRGRPLGGASFRSQIERMLARKPSAGRWGGRRAGAGRPKRVD